MKPIQIFFLVGFTIIIAGILSPLYAYKFFQGGLPYYGKAPKFSLLDSQAEPFDQKRLLDKISVVTFFFASCGEICPTINDNLSELHAKFLQNESVQIVSITVDPERDTPEKLEEYAARYRKNSLNWKFLRGASSAVQDIARGLKLGGGDSPEAHSMRLVLLDKKGLIRGYYDGLDPESVKSMATDIERLL